MGFIFAMRTFDMSRPGIGAQAVGIAQGALDEALKYAKQRKQFDKSIASFQGIQWMLADMATEIEAARALVYASAREVNAGVKDVGVHSAMAKMYASDVAMRVATDAVQIFGGYGYMKEYPVEKYMRDAKITQIYEGTNQIQRNIIGMGLLRESIQMNIIVCVKQVPDTSEVRIDPATNNLVREGVKSIVNPFDMYAIEEGVRLKEKFGGKVIVLTMGPPQAEAVLREAISLGCDEAVLVSDRAFAGSDTLATSYTLSKAIEKIKDYDVIICGKQAIDGDTAQVGPGIAATLDIPQITYVRKIEEIKDGTITAERATEEGYEVVETKLPCLMTVVKEINTPRLPSLKGKIKAKSAVIQVWKAADIGAEENRIGLKGSPTWVLKIFTPPPKPKGKIFEGEGQHVVDQLVDSLKGLLHYRAGSLFIKINVRVVRFVSRPVLLRPSR